MASKDKHEVKRKDWEVVLDQLYKRGIAPVVRGLAIVSNTLRENPSDIEGTLQEELTYRVKQKGQSNLAFQLRKFNTEAFYHFFKLRSESQKESQDFYRLKRPLPYEVLVYPLTQGVIKKAIMIFESPVESTHLQKIVRIVLEEMNKSATKSPKEMKEKNEETEKEEGK